MSLIILAIYMHVTSCPLRLCHTGPTHRERTCNAQKICLRFTSVLYAPICVSCAFCVRSVCVPYLVVCVDVRRCASEPNLNKNQLKIVDAHRAHIFVTMYLYLCATYPFLVSCVRSVSVLGALGVRGVCVTRQLQCAWY